MQKIYIENFGPIINARLDINDIMIFIGPQASGKSTISKSIYFFKSLKDELMRFMIECLDSKCFDKPLGTYAKRIRAKFLDFWGSTYHLSKIYLKYEYSSGVFIHIKLKGKYVDPDFSPEFKKKFKEIVKQAQLFSERKSSKDTMFLSSSELLAVESERRVFLSKIEHHANELFSDGRDIFFVPAGRSLLATLSDQLQYVQPHRLDFLMRAFIDRINSSKNLFSKNLSDLITERKKLTQEPIDFESLSVAQNKITKILKASYRYDSEGEKLYFSQDKYTKLNFASSGQQEVIWILLIIFLIILDNKNVYIVFEEPEAHLYPEAQKDEVELISLLSNLHRNQIIITTHSPYILSAFNNLLYGYKIGQRKPDEVSRIIDKRIWVNPNRLSAYFVSDGEIRCIIDKDTLLIESEAIDSASRIINDSFANLFDLDEN
jgi:predicted ATP-dependent endonuclease of OLD family